jgi:methionine biosynthesis protein MetW
MSAQRVAIIFDDTARPETTGGYCLRALKELIAVEHFRPTDLHRIPRDGIDLYLNIDDGLHYVLPADLHPSAWWAIDTHMDFDWCLQKSHGFDFIFAAQRDGALRLCDEGISATWLPLACDPGIHRKHDVPKQYDVCFVGNVFPGERADLVRLLQSRFRNHFVGQRYFEEMARTYSASRVVFNRSIRNDVNMRVFEAVACGALLVTNDLHDNGQEELFRDGVHLATYRDADELLDKVRFYLDREEVRERIAAAGRVEAVARHTYRHRMEAILKKCFSSPRTQRGLSAAKTDLSYFEFDRPEVVALVPETARRVLDIGCGAGRLGEAIKKRQAAEVVGIECVEEAAQAARARLDQVHVGDVETMEPPFAPESFDAVVCADVLEHLAEPERLLRRVHDWLRPGGRLVASMPNVRHHTVVRSLLEGNWTYEAAGLLDRTHLRFFTRRDIEDLVRRAGFAVEEVQGVPGPGDEEWWKEGRRDEVHAGRLHIAGLPAGEAEEFYVYQYLVSASPVAPGGPPVRPTDDHQPEVGRSEEAHRRAACATDHRRAAHAAKKSRLRIMLLGDFGSAWRHETLTANALVDQGHDVRRYHEDAMPSVDHVVTEVNSGVRARRITSRVVGVQTGIAH